jgi:hypothetical protein
MLGHTWLRLHERTLQDESAAPAGVNNGTDGTRHIGLFKRNYAIYRNRGHARGEDPAEPSVPDAGRGRRKVDPPCHSLR